MISVDVTWRDAAVGAGCLAAAAAVVLTKSRQPVPADSARAQVQRRLAGAGGFLREAALIVGLFALWQFAGSFAVLGPGGALPRARWLWQVERALHLPSEASVQRAFLPHPLLVQGFNLYYDILHFPVMILCLIWLFVAHRERYGGFRTTLAVFTGLCLVIQLIPVAPPRMLPGIGMVDTAARYGQSVYSANGGLNADQLSAMPSIHVGWAILVAIAIVGAATSNWRWLAVLYPVLTTLAVVVTANHFWLDGIVAAAVLAAALAGQATARGLLAGPSEDRAVVMAGLDGIAVNPEPARRGSGGG